jgi:hypothetical protein
MTVVVDVSLRALVALACRQVGAANDDDGDGEEDGGGG